MKLVSFIIPCYRSAGTITSVVEEINRSMELLPEYRHEIVLVNDCSPDDTFAVIEALASGDKRITAVDLAKNFGQHAAIMAGLSHCSGDYVVCLDDDGQTPADEVGKLLSKLEEGYDLVQGSRFIKGGKAVNTPFIRTVSVRCIHAPIISLTARHKFTDTTNAFRAYSARYLQDDRVKPLRDIFMTYELLAYLSVRATQIGLKACEIPVTRAYPKTGKTPTKISFFKGNGELMKILIRNAKGMYNPK